MSEKDDKKKVIKYDLIQSHQTEMDEALFKNIGKDLNTELMKAVTQNASSLYKKKKAPRLSFTEDPNSGNNYAGLFKHKRGLIPDNLLKQIRTQNFLIAAILRNRGNTLSLMGHIRKSRFDVGIELEIKKEFENHISPEYMVKIQERMDRALKILINCGYTEGLRDEEKMTLSEFLDLQTRNGLTFGRFATEIIWKEDEKGEKKFFAFRPVDVGTIYKAVPKVQGAKGIRQSSIPQLERMNDIEYPEFEKDLEEKDFSWVQVVNGQPRQAFAHDEMIVFDLFPSTDIEHNGYPVSPMDTVITSIITHTSIDIYNKLYFQNGRAARGILVIKSDDADQETIESIRQGYMAKVNDVSNSFSTPVLGVGSQDDIQWISTQPQKKDGEFQFLFDQTVRNILSAFGMSPDEMPGFAHLSRGTNTQSLSESNNEFKLIAQRDAGIRPLILKMQAFLDQKLFKIIDPELAQICDLKLSGFDAQTREQEAIELQQDIPLHMTYNEVLEKVEKETVTPQISGNMPFNERYLEHLSTFQTVGEIESYFKDLPGARFDSLLKYRRDQFWFQYLQMLGELNPAALKAYFASKKMDFEFFKLYIKDLIDEQDE